MINKKDIHLINKEIIQRQKRGITRFLAPVIIGDRIYGKRLYVVAVIKPVEKIEQVELSFRNKEFGSFEGEFVLFNF